MSEREILCCMAMQSRVTDCYLETIFAWPLPISGCPERTTTVKKKKNDTETWVITKKQKKRVICNNPLSFSVKNIPLNVTVPSSQTKRMHLILWLIKVLWNARQSATERERERKLKVRTTRWYGDLLIDIDDFVVCAVCFFSSPSSSLKFVFDLPHYYVHIRATIFYQSLAFNCRLSPSTSSFNWTLKFAFVQYTTPVCVCCRSDYFKNMFMIFV